MLGVYFSATGNTKYCVERLVKKLGEKSEILAMEDSETLTAIQNSDSFVFGYGVRFSNVPKIVHDWILTNKSIFSGKKILIIATMGAFSGDGSGCAARLFRKCGAKIVGGLHLRMPDVVADSNEPSELPVRTFNVCMESENELLIMFTWVQLLAYIIIRKQKTEK